MADIVEMAERGRNKARFSGSAHHLAAEIATRKSTWIGLAVVVLTSIVGTSIFASINEVPPTKAWQLTTGFVSLAAVVLSALQTFFQFAERAQMHLAAAAEFLTMRRRLDLFLVRYVQRSHRDLEQALQELAPMLEDLENITKKAPVISNSIYNRGKAKVIRSEQDAMQPKRTAEKSGE